MVERPSLDWEVVGSIPRSGKEVLSKNQNFLLRSKELSLSRHRKVLYLEVFRAFKFLSDKSQQTRKNSRPNWHTTGRRPAAQKIGASQVKTRQFGAIRVYGVVSGLDISKQGLLPMNEGQRHIGSFLLFQLKIIKIHGNTKAGSNIFSKL